MPTTKPEATEAPAMVGHGRRDWSPKTPPFRLTGERPTCASCAFYSRPGMLNAYCRHPGGLPDWMDVPAKGSPGWPNFDPAGAFVSARNSCERHVAAALPDERYAEAALAVAAE